MRGNAAIFVIIALAVLALMGYFIYSSFSGKSSEALLPSPSPSYSSLSEDPKYKEVKEKYNLSEEQLQILSTVDPEDNE